MRAARCGWCGAALVQAEVLTLTAWVCPTAACQARQLAHAVVTRPKGKKDRVCHFIPLPSQLALYECAQRYILWGGAAGPGKSTGARWWLYERAMRTPGHQALLLRENWNELDTTHLRRMAHEVPALGGRFYHEARKAVFGTGSTEAVIDCGHMADAEAVRRYLSTNYHAIVCDEGSQYPVDRSGISPLGQLSGRAREYATDVEGQPVNPRFVVVTNPGGPSSPFLTDFYIHHTPDLDVYPQLKDLYRPEQWVYLAAKLDDNPYLDEDYESVLANNVGWRYEQLRHGDWDVFGGQFFGEWLSRSHVRRLELDLRSLNTFCSMDWGYNAPGDILWWACLPDGHYHIVREYKFQQMTVEQVAQQWHVINREIGAAQPAYVVADPSMFSKTGHGRGETYAETLQRCRVPMRRGDNDRFNGWGRVHELLRGDRAGVPWLTVDPGCAYLVRSIPAQRSDSLHPDDVDTTGDDHAVDALRYGAMSRPSPTQMVRQAKKLHPWLEDALLASSAQRPLGSDQVRPHV